MLPTIHLKNEIEKTHVPVTLVNMSMDLIQLTKHTPLQSLQLYRLIKTIVLLTSNKLDYH